MVSEIYSLADCQITSRRKNIKKLFEWKIWSIATYGFEKLHLSTYWRKRRIILNRPKNNKIRRPQFLCIVGCEGKTRKNIF